jgi:hypothetical protein
VKTGQKETLPKLFDHRVGAQEEGGRHVEAEHLGRRHIDGELELGGLLDRQVAWLGALEDATRIGADLIAS